jgi:hypothetical protein
MFPGIRELIFRGFKEFPEEFSQIFNVLSSDSAFEEDDSIAGVGLFVRTPENVEPAEDMFRPGFAKRYDQVFYSLSIGASHQVRKFDKTGFWKERAPDLGFSARQTREILIADLINQGFTAVTGPDGKPLFATDHPNIVKGTQSNILTPVGSVSVLSVRTGLQQFRRFFDDTGVRRRMLMADWLAHAPEEEYNVLEILKSAGRPDTANRADNVIRNALKPFCWDYLTDPNNWFIFSGKGQHKLKVYDSEKFHVWDDMDKKTRIQWVIAAMAFAFGHSHWIGTLGSNPV